MQQKAISYQEAKEMDKIGRVFAAWERSTPYLGNRDDVFKMWKKGSVKLLVDPKKVK